MKNSQSTSYAIYEKLKTFPVRSRIRMHTLAIFIKHSLEEIDIAFRQEKEMKGV